MNGTRGEDKKGERKGEPRKKGEEPKEKKNGCGKNALARNGEKKNGLGKKNASEKNGEKKNGSGKKNGFTKNGEKKNGRGNKNALGKNGLKKNCREEKKTRDLGSKSCPLVPKRVAGRAAETGPPEVCGGRGTAEASARTGTTGLCGGRGTSKPPARIGMAEVCGGRGTTEVRLVAEREDRSAGRAMSGRDRPEPLARPSFRKNCEGQSLKPCMVGTDCERENPENAGGLVEKRETSPRWLNPGLPIWVKPGPRPNPPAREPKELILCPEQGIPQTTMTKPRRSQIRGGILHLALQQILFALIRRITQTGRLIATEMSDSCLLLGRRSNHPQEKDRESRPADTGNRHSTLPESKACFRQLLSPASRRNAARYTLDLWLHASLSPCFCCCFPQFSSKDKPRLQHRKCEKRLTRFITAFDDLDWDTFRLSFDDNATVFYPRGFPERASGRAEFEKNFKTVFEQIRGRRTEGPYMDIQPRALKIQLFGDVAIATFHLDDRVGFMNRRTIVLKKTKVGWKIVHLHASEVLMPTTRR